MSSTLYIGQLSYDATEDDVARVFRDHHIDYEKISVPYSQEKGRGKGFAFVDLRSHSDVRNALEEMRDVDIRGRVVFIREKREVGDKGRGRGRYESPRRSDRHDRRDDRRGGGSRSRRRGRDSRSRSRGRR